MKITLLGLGSILMRDDGVGVHAVKAVQERYDAPPELDIVDGGTAGLDLLPFIEGRDRVLFDDIPAFFTKDKSSLHHIGLTDVLAMARLLNILPEEVCLIGIQPQDIELGLDLTEILQEKLDRLVGLILDKLRDWDVVLVPRSQ
jgi:hydrogenase maturation protease